MERFKQIVSATEGPHTPPAHTIGTATVRPPDPRSVLLVERERSEAEAYTSILRAVDLQCIWARGIFEGLSLGVHAHPHLLLAAVRLPDMVGLESIRTLRARHPDVPLILLSSGGMLSQATLRDVMAQAVLIKPSRPCEVIAAVRTFLAPRSARRTVAHMTSHPPYAAALDDNDIPHFVLRPPRSAAERWASFVIDTIDAEADPKTITDWARAGAVSRSSLSECCRLVGVSAHDARDFSRIVRAICRSSDRWQPEIVLDPADTRTLKRLLSSAGFLPSATRTPTTREFVERQQWIPQNNAGLSALRRLLFDE